jgi:hypothetical protein
MDEHGRPYSYEPYERPDEGSEEFTELFTFGDRVIFGFDYNHTSHCGYYQMCRERQYCACSRMYRLHATLLPNLVFADEQLFWFVLHEDISEYDTTSAQWEATRCFLFDSSGQWQRITPWYRGSLFFRKPTLTEAGSVRLDQDAAGFATERSTGRFLYWLVLLPQCGHEPEPDHVWPLGHDLCRQPVPTWLNKELPEWTAENEPSDEPRRLAFTWIELDGPLAEADPALEQPHLRTSSSATRKSSC